MWFNIIDDKLFPLMNGSDNLFLDGVMTSITSAYTWIPLFLSLIFIIIRNNDLIIFSLCCLDDNILCSCGCVALGCC